MKAWDLTPCLLVKVHHLLLCVTACDSVEPKMGVEGSLKQLVIVPIIAEVIKGVPHVFTLQVFRWWEIL
jgi:hypothetical protein